jgi:NADP-dependent 3-hydroxy acid dehydrogenase YdfG
LIITSFNSKGSVACITGKTRKNGIGHTIVEALPRQGAKKVYATARNVSQLENLVAEHNGKVVAVIFNASQS